MKALAFFRRPAWRGVWLGLVCALAVWLVTRADLLRGLEDWMLDGCFNWRGPRPTTAPVVLIGLDEESLNELGKPLALLSPELAEVVTYAHAQGASAIGIDLIISEALAREPDIDRPGARGDGWKMGQAVIRAGNVVLPQWLLPDGFQRPLPQWRLKADFNPEPTDLGFVDLSEDGDRFVRRQPLLVRRGSEAVPHFALALYARARGQPFAWDDDRAELYVGQERIPLDAEQKLRINFAGPPGTFQPLPFRRVLRAARKKRPWPEFEGAIVVIGIMARSQQDYHSTPYANHYASRRAGYLPGLMAGPEVHAHVLATLHDRAYITPSWLGPLPLLLLVGPGLGWAFARLTLAGGLLVVVAHLFAWLGLTQAAFTYAHWRVELVPLLLLGLLTYVLTFLVRWRTLRRMFGVVKSAEVVRALEADPRRLDLAGETRQVTVLFADIRNFTDYAEAHDPHEVVALLNAYFRAIVPLLESEKGTIDKYLGDGVMVLFGATAAGQDHALRAVRAAIAMVRQVHEQRDTWARLDRLGVWEQGMRIGVGIHTGPAVVGAVGSPQRLDYTAIGDTINCAARIEAANKTEGTEILISAATYALLPEKDRGDLGCEPTPLKATVKGRRAELYLHPVQVPEPSRTPAGPST
jgi:adenylate cyclase